MAAVVPGDDARFMLRALGLAAQAYGQTSPNPLVGAVVVRGGEVAGSGAHLQAGAPHAEPLALDAARAAGAFGADCGADLALYVNLEPCAHHGRTPPCIDAILASPVRRVVAAMIDPDPRTAGEGAARLRAGGVRVDVGCCAEAAAELNHVFVGRLRRGRPFVALKVALSADGCIAPAGGGPSAITGLEARRHAHRLRAGHDAILIGVETLAADRPRLDRRLYDGPGRAPRRLVVDPQLRADPEWLWPGEAPPPVVFCSRVAFEKRASRLGRAAEIVPVPGDPARLDVLAVVRALEPLGLYSVLVEGGGRTHRAFLEARLWDRAYVYRNPGLRLGGMKWTAETAWRRESEGLAARATEVLGEDLCEIWVHPQLS